MLISIDWIRDFTPVPNLPAKDIYSRFTLSTAEVEDVVVVNDHLEKIVVAEILSFEKHPEADKLNLVTFRISETDIRKVVCGASNVKVGIKIPFAPLGVKLPNGLLLEAKKIRGVLSEGMLCSEEELGFAEDSNGIMELPLSTPLGMSMLELFKLKKDTILDIDNKSLTHRPDLWGHFGMSREFSAMFDLPLNDRFSIDWTNSLKNKFTTEKSPVIPRFDGDSAGVSYYGLSIDNVKVSDSPEWMKARLKSCGLRPINNIVDVSNYVMLELGLPLHIFDRDLINGSEVVIKKLDSHNEFKTLDDVTRKLIPGDTVISDSNGPLVLAGIMGGINSGVSLSTNKIFIEVANWKTSLIRRTSTRLGLRTDSSQRFEKSLDSCLCERTMLRTLELILELCPEAKVVGKLQYAGIDLSQIKKLVITTSLQKINTVLGTNISNENLIKIFNSLDFNCNDLGNKIIVEVPSYRSTKDIEQEADLIEEIGRIIGYDNIVPLSPLDTISPVKLTEMQRTQRKIRDFLVFQGKSFELMTYPLIGQTLLNKVSWPLNSNLKLINSLSQDHDLMRPSLIPSLLEAAELNVKHQDRFRVFEIGRAYSINETNFSNESTHVAIAFYEKEKSCFIDLINTAENLLSSLNLPFDLSERNSKFSNPLVPSEWIGNHPFEFINIRVMGKFAGALFSVHPLVLRNLKIRGNLSFFILDLTFLDNVKLKDKIKYKPLSKFPSSNFDWTVVAPLYTSVSDILSLVKKVKIKELQAIEILDVFQNNSQKYVTIRATLSDMDATLSTDALKLAEKSLIDATSKGGFNLK